MDGIRLIGGEALIRALPWNRLIPGIARLLAAGIETAPRQLLPVGGPAGGLMGVMAAWMPGRFAGVKAVSSFSQNRARGEPSVGASYLLIDASNGRPLACLDGAALTVLRTAAGSALAADRLARPDARTLLVVGTGAVAPALASAHAAVRRYARVLLWGRNPQRAAAAAAACGATPVADLEAAAREADVIACATGATEPLIRGGWLRPGVHLDLVGSFTPAMREADAEAVRAALIYVDCVAEALQSGELQGLGDRIAGDLVALARLPGPARRGRDRTLYKSAGFAALDLAAAMLAWEARDG